MGNAITSLFNLLFWKKQVRIVMLGLDNAGKTTILYRLKLGHQIITIPTIGFNVETVDYKNINFTIWDVRGGGKIMPLWHHYFVNTQGLIFVIDSTDRERLDEAIDEFIRVLQDEKLRDAVFLILANKQDLPNAITETELTDKLRLDEKTMGSVKWHIQPTSAATGDGLFEGLEWLTNQLK